MANGKKISVWRAANPKTQREAKSARQRWRATQSATRQAATSRVGSVNVGLRGSLNKIEEIVTACRNLATAKVGCQIEETVAAEQSRHGQCGVKKTHKKRRKLGSLRYLSTANMGKHAEKVAARATPPRPMWGAKRAEKVAVRATSPRPRWGAKRAEKVAARATSPPIWGAKFAPHHYPSGVTRFARRCERLGLQCAASSFSFAPHHYPSGVTRELDLHRTTVQVG